MTDEINLHDATIHASPSDIASWPITLEITGLTMQTVGGLTLEFDAPPPDAWKWFGIGEGGDNVQFTVWAVVQVRGVWHAAAFVQMWQGREMGKGSLPPILTQFVNWWGDIRHLWGDMSDYVPAVGDVVGFFVSAGNARLFDGVTSLRERSNVIAVALPANDSGEFGPGPTPQPAPAPPPIVAYDEQQVDAYSTDAANAYAQAGQVLDRGFGIWIARMQFDAVAIGYAASRAKHLAELRAALGLRS